MATVALTADTFDETVEGNDVVLVDFWAGWCGPCKMFAPIYEELSGRDEFDGVVFAKVDTEAEPDVAAAFQIRSIPTLMVFKEQVQVFSQAGALPREAMEDLLSQVEALDMDAVREQIATQQAG